VPRWDLDKKLAAVRLAVVKLEVVKLEVARTRLLHFRGRLSLPLFLCERPKQRNRYLMGELDRRDKEKAAEVGRPWWKWRG
jgi:hypothetical protein